MNNVLNNIKNTLKNKETIVVATSGGPDSMVLLELLNKIKEEKNLKIICAHVNHNLRQESQEEAQMVEKYCKKNNITFEKMTIKNYGKGNTENLARIKRYNFFEELINKHNGSYLLTAHHGDDLIETILMRIVRGSSFKGYAGFKKITELKNYKIYRPLITKTKSEILKYADKNKIPYAIDKTNKENTYTRNRIRNHILPYLKEENKNVHLKFLKLNETLNDYYEYIKEEVNKIIPNIYQNGEINIEKLKKQNKVIQKEIIYSVLNQIYQNDINKINETHVNSILKLLDNNKPNIKINLPKNIIVQKEYNKLRIKEQSNPIIYKERLKDNLKLPNGKIIEIVEKSNDTSNFICYLNKKEIKLPLIVRTRKPGDKIKIKGLNGSKKIKDIFIDEKIDKSQRNAWPILTDANDKILWIPGLKKSKFDKTKDKNYDIIVRYR